MTTPTEDNIETTSTPREGRATRDFETAQRRLFEGTDLHTQSRFINLENPRVRTHVFESGPIDDDPPLVFVHGGMLFGAFFAPLMAQFDDTRMIAFDRPGYGLSDRFVYTKGNIRQNASDVIGGVLDELGIERADLVGQSGGGYASIQFALAHPERVRRLILIGAVANFPGTPLPVPFRLMTVPLLNHLLQRLQKPGEEGVLDFLELVGEREAIQRYPALIRAMAAHQDVIQARGAGMSELKAHFSIRGWRASSRIREEELRNIQQPTLAIWGTNDPFGTPEEVRDSIDLIPDVRLETMDSGHAVFLRYPERCAQLIHEMRERNTHEAE
ncbi:alpha/beta fold hydrolase [Natrialbaceae archaeon GCM10025810]|uniref:alpha/beta fold hydrolase n=1 Tax=Halovalidus salilacus TaxID=3075124 RepID=UPI0036190E9B